jgi:predicted AAA+ superfamily ATPase
VGLSLLEASYIVFLLRPHFNNFNKRIIKAPKIYFYDTGLACSLLGIRSPQDVQASPFRGALFESLIIADFYKQYYNNGFEPHLYFWRDQNGRVEVDCIVDLGGRLIPIEIKSSATIVADFFDGIGDWHEVAATDSSIGYIVYAGDQNQRRSAGNVISFASAGTLIDKIEKL